MEIMENKIMNESECLTCFLYQTKYFYIATLPKVASSWLFDLTHTYPEIMDIESTNEFWAANIHFNQIDLTILKDDENSSYKFDEVKRDWDTLIHGNTDISRNFIFLLRNPVNKFISGLMQDVLYQDKSDPQKNPLDLKSELFLKIFTNYPNKSNLEKLKLLNDEMISKGFTGDWWIHDGDWWNDVSFSEIINYWIEQKFNKFFSAGFNVRDYKSDHKASNIYLYHKILFNSQIDKNKIKILDIDTENIYDYLIKEYKLENIISDVTYKDGRNVSSKVFKKLLIKNSKNYSEFIQVVLREDIFMYIDIYKKIYGVELDYNHVIQQLE